MLTGHATASSYFYYRCAAPASTKRLGGKDVRAIERPRRSPAMMVRDLDNAFNPSFWRSGSFQLGKKYIVIASYKLHKIEEKV